MAMITKLDWYLIHILIPARTIIVMHGGGPTNRYTTLIVVIQNFPLFALLLW